MTNDNNEKPSFHVYEVALELTRTVAPVIEKIGRRDRGLADQVRRAIASAPLNIREGSRRAGRDRLHSYRIAAGSADEVVGALEVAEALGYLARRDLAPALGLADRVLAMVH